jgi:hypothetical protein
MNDRVFMPDRKQTKRNNCNNATLLIMPYPISNIVITQILFYNADVLHLVMNVGGEVIVDHQMISY